MATHETEPESEKRDTETAPFDEETLGRSTSVFDTTTDTGESNLIAPTAPPLETEQKPEGRRIPTFRLSSSERRQRVKLEARRVRRIIRHVEPWSVLKISIFFYASMWLILNLAGVLLWSFAESSGTLASVEDLIKELFTLDPEQEFWQGGIIFRAYSLATAIICITGVAASVLMCVVHNLLSDLVGGIRLTVIEEESARFVPPKRRSR